MMREVTERISTLNRDVLNGLARKLGLSKEVKRKDEVIALLERYVEHNLRDLVALVSEDERTLLREAAHNGGEVDAIAFQAKYGVPCPLPHDPGFRYSQASPLLLLFGHEYRVNHLGGHKLPSSLATQLRAILEKPASVNINTAETIPAEYAPSSERWRKPEPRPVHIHEGEKIVFPEMRGVLKLAQAGKLKITDKSSRPTDTTVRLVSEALVVPDFQVEPPPRENQRWREEPGGAIRAHAWAVLLQQCGWTKARGGRLILTPEGQALLASARPAEFRAGVERFVADGQFDELNRINHLRGQSGGGKRHLTPPGERRLAIWESIEEWPVNRWITFDEAVRFLHATGRRFRVTDGDYSLYFCEMMYGSLGGQGAGIDCQYMRAFLFESLGTLGVIDVAYTYPHHLWPELGHSWGIDELSFCGRYDGLLYVRLNALGAYCLGLTDNYDTAHVPATPTFRVLPNQEITLLGPLSPADRHMLTLFASEKSEFVWELDGARVLSHMESGGKAEDALEFLAANSADPIPETVQRRLSDLGARAEAVRGVEEALLVELGSDMDAALIAHDGQAGKFCRLAGEKHLAVPKRNYRAFRSAIKKLGFIIPDAHLPA